MKFFIFLCLYLQCIYTVHSWRPYKIVIKEIKVEHADSQYITIPPITVKSKPKIVMTAYGEVFKDLPTDNLVVQLEGYQLVNGNYKPALLNNTLDICVYFKKPLTSPLINMIYPSLQRAGNLPTSCPIKKGKYGIVNFEVNENKLPPYMPEGHWRIDTTLKDLTTEYAKINWIFQIDYSHTVVKL